MLTQEQQAVVDTVCSANKNSPIIAVNSIAGSGKTATGNAVIRAYKPKNGFYTAFNKAIVKDSASRFGDLLECKTIHALAYKHIKPTREIEDLNYLTIKESMDYASKAIVIDTLDNFFRSSSTDIEEYVEEVIPHDEKLREVVVEYANKMLEGKIPPTFNYLLKCLHLMLANGELEINYDLLVLDECQDTTAVALEIFKLINANAKVIFGDKFQNIYSFMDTVNAFEELDNLHLLRLTKSFRCSPEIAAMVEAFGKKYLEADFQYKGNEEVKPEDEFKVAYLTRTNAALITRMYNLVQNNQSFKLTRSVNDIFALPMALLNAASGKPVYDKRYKFLQVEYNNYKNIQPNPYKSFYEYLMNTVDDVAVENTCNMLMMLMNKNINLYELKKQVASLKPDKNVILTTAHAFKGLEMNNVFIEEDLNISVRKSIDRLHEQLIMDDDCKTLLDARKYLSRDMKENLNTYYVALSRARTNLINVNYY